MGAQCQVPKEQGTARTTDFKGMAGKCLGRSCAQSTPEHRRTPVGRREGTGTTSAHGPLARKHLPVFRVISARHGVRGAGPAHWVGEGYLAGPLPVRRLNLASLPHRPTNGFSSAPGHGPGPRMYST